MTFTLMIEFFLDDVVNHGCNIAFRVNDPFLKIRFDLIADASPV